MFFYHSVFLGDSWRQLFAGYVARSTVNDILVNFILYDLTSTRVYDFHRVKTNWPRVIIKCLIQANNNKTFSQYFLWPLPVNNHIIVTQNCFDDNQLKYINISKAPITRVAFLRNVFTAVRNRKLFVTLLWKWPWNWRVSVLQYFSPRIAQMASKVSYSCQSLVEWVKSD